MITVLLQLLLVLFLLAIVVFGAVLLWDCITCKSDTASAATTPAAGEQRDDATVTPEASEPAQVAAMPTESSDSDTVKPSNLLQAPADGKGDNLCRIKGIGVVIEKKLNELGVYYFEQIAAWSDKELAWIDEHISFRGRALRDDWVGQAARLARGEETEFSKRVDRGEVASSNKEA